MGIGTILTFLGTTYAIVSGRKTAKENADIAALAVTREDWVASQEQGRKDRAELRQANDELRRNNESLALNNRELAKSNRQLQADMDEMKVTVEDLRHGLDRALGHVARCEDELVALRGEPT